MVSLRVKAEDIPLDFEIDYDRANYLAEKYPYITVINADPLDAHTFDKSI